MPVLLGIFHRVTSQAFAMYNNERWLNLSDWGNMCIWVSNAGSWKKLRKIKPVWKEPQGGSPEALEESIQEYYEAIKDGRGGIFFAVCRGKVRLQDLPCSFFTSVCYSFSSEQSCMP